MRIIRIKDQPQGALPMTDPASPSVETISNALLYLMTAYQRTQCPCVAGAIVRHLEYLAALPSTTEPLRLLCTRLQFDWRQPAARNGGQTLASVESGARH
jgi:hypothetical protein